MPGLINRKPGLNPIEFRNALLATVVEFLRGLHHRTAAHTHHQDYYGLTWGRRRYASSWQAERENKVSIQLAANKDLAHSGVGPTPERSQNRAMLACQHWQSQVTSCPPLLTRHPTQSYVSVFRFRFPRCPKLLLPPKCWQENFTAHLGEKQLALPNQQLSDVCKCNQISSSTNSGTALGVTAELPAAVQSRSWRRVKGARIDRRDREREL